MPSQTQISTPIRNSFRVATLARWRAALAQVVTSGIVLRYEAMT